MPGGVAMPLVILRTGVTGADGGEETLSEYLCDSPGCPNYAEQVIGFAREFGQPLALCAEHATILLRRDRSDSENP
jgi:hypothetical protein